MPLVAGIALANAGAMTSAKRIGVSNGTRISRGVCALSAKRRRAKVVNTANQDGRTVARRVPVVWSIVVVVVRVVTGFSVFSGGGREAVARQLQVHVVEGRGSCGRGDHGDAVFVDGGRHVAG